MKKPLEVLVEYFLTSDKIVKQPQYDTKECDTRYRAVQKKILA